MIVYPAVDIRGGRCVQLEQGAVDSEVVHDEDPVAQAQRWVAEGAEALHVVNLDGTLAYAADGGAAEANLAIVRRIRQAVDIPIQFAGGLRSIEDLDVARAAGVDAIVIGTAAVYRPDVVDGALQRWGSEGVAVALEVRGGRLVTHGWQHASDIDPAELGRQMYHRGVRTMLYTDVDREGLLGGIDPAAALRLSAATGLAVVVSGGVAGIDDIDVLAKAGPPIAGVVIGQAIYTGRLSLREAVERARG